MGHKVLGYKGVYSYRCLWASFFVGFLLILDENCVDFSLSKLYLDNLSPTQSFYSTKEDC